MPCRRPGLALVVVSGTLAVMALLGGAFATLARLERRASAERVLATRALLLARAGLEDATARLAAGQTPLYGGEDWAGNGLLDTYNQGQQVFMPAALNTLDCPVRHALRPSFFARDPLGLPRRISLEGRHRAFSGLLPEGTYALKVEDESGKIHVNGGLLDGDRDADGIPDHRDPDVRLSAAPADTGLGWNAQLVRILNLLGQQPEIAIPNLGTLVLLNRPAGGYLSIRALQAVLGTTKDLSPYLTVSTWSDPDVVHPNGYKNQPAAYSQNLVKDGRRPLALEPGGRPPVNLETAPRPVLIALISGLEGTSWHVESEPKSVALTGLMATQVADALIAFRKGQDPGGLFAAAGLTPGPLRTWSRFNAFCDALVPQILKGFHTPGIQHGGNLCAADLLKANFDPNTRLAKHLPDQLMWRWMDKSDLTTWSTEGCLSPTGRFRVAAVGRVTGPGGRLAASRELEATVEAFRLLRQTTQAHFVAGRTPSSLPRYLSTSTGFPQTAGETAGPAWWGGPSPGKGLAVATYPCPIPALPAAAADFDGAIALATIETPATDPANGRLMFLHHFDDGWTADPVPSNPGGIRDRMPGPNSGSLLDPPTGSVWPGNAALSNSVYPDGIHEQLKSAPAYDALSNFPPANPCPPNLLPSNHGVIGYWIKSQTTPWPCRLSFSLMRGEPEFSQTLFIGLYGGLFGVFAENTAVSYCQRIYGREFQQYGQALMPGARWQLLTAHFDTDHKVLGQEVYLDMRGVTGTGTPDPVHGYTTLFDTTENENLIHGGDRCVFELGGHDNIKFMQEARWGNQVVDEVAICDFEDDAPLAIQRLTAWAATRYQDGRYYKENDGTFLSSVLAPSPGEPARLLRAEWTAFFPAEGRKEIPTAGVLPIQGSPRLLDATLRDAGLVMTLLEADGSTPVRTLAQGGGLGLSRQDFRYRVTFRPTPNWTASERMNRPVLESPWLDDITFAWQAASGPRILGYGVPFP